MMSAHSIREQPMYSSFLRPYRSTVKVVSSVAISLNREMAMEAAVVTPMSSKMVSA